MTKGFKFALIFSWFLYATSGSSATEVIIEFGPEMQPHMERLNRFEKQREIRIRGKRPDSFYRSPSRWYGRSTAEERLIPDLNDYSIETLVQRMVDHNLKSIGQQDTERTLVVRIEDFYVDGYNLSVFDGPHELMRGRLMLLDADGTEIFNKQVMSYGIPKERGGSLYYGDGHPYPEAWFSRRFGPMLATFLHKGMSATFPDAEVPRAVAKARF